MFLILLTAPTHLRPDAALLEIIDGLDFSPKTLLKHRDAEFLRETAQKNVSPQTPPATDT
jgi:hypothetical protein